IPPNAVTVHPCPAGMYWLRAVVRAFGHELLEHLRREPLPPVRDGYVASQLARYLDALEGWLRRQLCRHADLRAMRARVAQALALDPLTMNLARHIHRNVTESDAEVTATSWNTAVRHRAALLQVRKDLPQ